MNGKNDESNSMDRHIELPYPSHEDASTMKLYVLGELSDQDAKRIEQHMADCEACLLLFMEAVESEQSAIASHEQLPDMEQMGMKVRDILLSELEQDEPWSAELLVQEKPYRRRTWLQHPITHFSAAAAITLLLLGTGSFNGVSERLTDLDREEQVRQQEGQDTLAPTWSDRMVSRTLTWLDGVQEVRFNKE